MNVVTGKMVLLANFRIWRLSTSALYQKVKQFHTQPVQFFSFKCPNSSSHSQWTNKRLMSSVSASAKTRLDRKRKCAGKNCCDDNVICECEFEWWEKFLTDTSTEEEHSWTNSVTKSWHYPTNKGKGSLLMETMTQPLTVCVEGNIGSGKTTFLKYFKKYPQVAVFDEPISKWRDCQGYNLLDLMYKDPRKWSLCFQSYVQLTMLDLHTKPIVQPIKMMERSIFSAQYCFVQNLRDEGLMDDPQYSVLSEWFNFSMTNLPIKVDLIVYLRTDPEVAYERIGQRGRSEENSIKLEYLQSVHKYHEDWLVHNPKLPCPVLTIDANTELADMTPNYLLCEKQMFQKVAVAN